ncbi:hypothetical protein L1049_027008 [Liquidambar formosana]|uniref:ZF-HD dimerization-type domain-containing protein n=1 Tax=Liquidambar formosana TaxID=63359 RepID=A0AAP0NES3_LIQFO
MEFDEHEDQEEEMGIPVPPSYESLGNSGRPKMGTAGVGTGEGGASSAARKGGGGIGGGGVTCRYRECLKNHAVGLGGHAVDGCGEFLAAGEEGTLESLKCAACNCHRNFHRKEIEGEGSFPHHHHAHAAQFSPYYRTPPAGYLHITQPIGHHRQLALPATSGGGGGAHSREEQEDMSNPSSSGGGGGGSGGSKKRFRTKFTQEQKDKMLAFAETVGWRIQKHDEAAVQQFCTETNVRRHVLKVWMHNNKHTLGKKP